jgi:uncharacterized protein (AIM24 family)/Tfp pilus assembly protein PilF
MDQGIFLLHLNRARRGLREGKLDAAWEELAQARLLRPEDEDVLNLLSVLEFKRGHYAEAERAARALLSENPSSAVLHSNLGLILFRAGRLAEAESTLRAAIELKPSHRRSHLYLGLLYRTRGKLGLALEHLRYAGARQAVSEIEEKLRHGAREARSRVPHAPIEGPAEPAEPVLRLAGPPPAAPESSAFSPPFLEEGPESEEPQPEPVLVPPVSPPQEQESPLFQIHADGRLEIASRGVVFVRKGSVIWYSGKIRFTVEPSFRGTTLEKILRATGGGTLSVAEPGRRAFRRDLSGEALHLEGSRLLALDHGLSFRLQPIHDFRRKRRIDILKIFGRGSVVLSVGGGLLAHEVTSQYPLILSTRDLVAWTGELVASVVEDEFLEEVMQPDVASPPKIRFEGEGTVLTEPPRPRRRASDLARPPEVDRRRS